MGVRGLPAGFPASALASTAWVVQTTRQTHRPPTKKVSLQGGEQEQGQALRAQSRTTSSARALRAHQPRGPIPHAKIFENYTKNSRDLRAGFGPGSGRARAGFGPGSGRVRAGSGPGSGRVRAGFGPCTSRLLQQHKKQIVAAL